MIPAEYIQQGLVKRGLPAHVAQGFVMNMQDESGLNPGINEIAPIVPGSRGGYGLYQLTGPRRVAYESFAQKRGVALDNPDAQLDFLMSELQGPERRAAQSILSTRNPQDAAVAIARDFLRPAASNLDKRVNRYKGAAPMMQQEEKPRGLLGSLGIQKMEEGAEGETGQRFYRRDSFKDTAAILAQGFGRMGIMGMEEIADDIAKQRTEVKAKNKTMEAIGKMGTPQSQQALEYIKAGGDPVSALKIAFSKPDPVNGVAMGDRLINPRTGEVMADFSGGYDAEAVSKARKEFTSQPFVKDFTKQTSAYGRIISSVNDPSPSGDLALIFNFMKVLDPGSTVREGEFATAAQAGKVDDRVRNLYNRVWSGETLTAAQRADFAGRAAGLYAGAESQYKALADQYAGFAEAAGLPVEQVIPDFSYAGSRYEKPLEMQLPPMPSNLPPGTTQEEWAEAWANMSDETRREILGR